MKLTVIVLARDPRTAKTRLRGALGPAARERLAAAMLDDVLAAALATHWPVLVVTDARSIGTRARAAGARATVVGARGTRDGARRGVRRALRDGADAVLIVAADVPLLRAADLRQIAAAGRRSEIVIVPDRGRSGTNALYLRPPSRIAPRFGPASLAAHRKAAGAAGRVLAISRLALDVDTPADLDALRRMKRRAGPRTRAALGRTARGRAAAPGRSHP
jgi:2-phospho-L-lactate/phosphoenolpyruvate guanylyltransferase